MKTERMEKVRKATAKHLTMESNKTLMNIREEFSDNPASMEYFYSLYEKVFCHGESVWNGRKVIGTTCVHVPDELIVAAGGVRYRLCSGAHAYDQIGSEFMPLNSCSMAKATVGALHINSEELKKRLSMIVVPTTCDQKKKAISMLEEMDYKIHTLELPSTKHSEESAFYWRNSVKKFAQALTFVTGSKITGRGMKKAITKIGKAREQFRRLYNLRKINPPVILGKDVLLATNAYFFDDVDRWTEAVAKLNDELEKRVDEGFTAGNKHAPRILFTGSPAVFPNLKLPLLLESLGGIIVADESCSTTGLLHDAVSYDESNLHDMMAGVAERYLKPCTCPIFTPNDDRKRKLLELVEKYQVDGVIYQSFSGCHVYEIENRSISNMFMDKDIPMLYIETDYSPEDMGQLSTRVSAFLESIKAQKRRRTRS